MFGAVVPKLIKACQTVSTISHLGPLVHFPPQPTMIYIPLDRSFGVVPEGGRDGEIPFGGRREIAGKVGGRASFSSFRPPTTIYIANNYTDSLDRVQI